MRRRTRTSLLIAGIVAVLLAALILLRQKAPPEAARLLPESEGIVYFNLKPLRAATRLDQRPVHRDPTYQRFTDATGFVFERDLNEAAFALHRLPQPDGPNGAVAFSEVFVGHFDGKRIARYLDGLSTGRESYAGHTVYTVPSESRTVRVTLLGYDMVAVSNAPTPEQIHAILDRYRTAALPFAGSSVLSEYYRDVPALAIAWGIGKLSLPLTMESSPQLFGMHLPISPDTTFIASVRWFGSLHLRIEEIAPSVAAATSAAESARGLMSLFRAAEGSFAPNAADADMRDLINSTRVESRGDRAVLSAAVPISLVQKVVTPPDGSAPLAGPVVPETALPGQGERPPVPLPPRHSRPRQPK